MKRTGFPFRVLTTLLLLGMSGSLIWFGVWTNRMAGRDYAFELKHTSGNLFSEVLYLKGNYEYFVDLDMETAAAYFRKAVVHDPLLIEAWFALAKVHAVQGRKEETQKLCDLLLPSISHVSTWKWQEFLLAFDLGDEKRFAETLNFILARLAHRRNEAFLLAHTFWRDWNGIILHVTAENRKLCFEQLLSSRETDLAVRLWERMKEDRVPVDKDLGLRFCQFLMENDRMKMAKELWREITGSAGLGVCDGEFGTEPLNTAFGWRFGKTPAAIIEITRQGCTSGDGCLHIRFNGTENVAFHHVSQTVPVEPGRKYRLHFFRRSSALTTDKGVFLEVTGYRCSGLNVATSPVGGTTPWTEEELEVAVPDACEAITVKVSRKDSLRFDNKISGDYWLDGVAVE
ncbi:MAG TPA: hypothetical protein PK250_14890 [Syntrophobacter fumaroxidans]|nr:hypothetical protein [Syntrophobacter fumaroxidans]